MKKGLERYIEIIDDELKIRELLILKVYIKK